MTSQLCAVIDYGMGNLHSAHGALQAVATDTKIVVTSDLETIRSADRIVLPGVGGIRDCIQAMQDQGIDELVRELVNTKPLLGICVGMQAMLQRSEENGGVDCLGLFRGNVNFFGDHLESHLEAQDQRLKVPHMGWNEVQQSPHPLWQGIPDNSRFYFVHSYFADAVDASQAKGSCHYGRSFTAAIGQDNVFAVQFHPEKSHRTGLALLRNFLAWDGQS